jgi:hypothetical protein
MRIIKMETKKTNPHTELTNSFKGKNGVQDKLGKLEDFDLSNDISYNEQFLYRTIGNYFVALNPDFKKILSGVWNSVFKNNYTDQLQDLKKVGADMSNYPKELGEFLN